MSQPLFLDPTIKIEKRAFSTRLDGETNNWPTEIVREAYKQLPFLKGYETDVSLDKVDSARGYAVGKMIVYPAGMKKEAAVSSDKLISIPLIVREKEMCPLDVFVFKGAAVPLDEQRVQGILFRPEIFDRNAKEGSFGDTTLADQMRPPESDQRFTPVTLSKTSSAKPSLWKAASASFRRQDVEDFKQQLKDNPPLRHRYMTDENLREKVEDLLNLKEKTAAEILKSSPKPTVIQFSASRNGFLLKMANHNAYEPETAEITRFEAEARLSSESFKKLQETGRLLLTIDPVAKSSVEKTAQEADRLGVYNAWSGGKEYSGVVVPKMVTFEGRELDTRIFSAPEVHAVQEKIAGVFAEDVILPEGVEPRGKGVFVYQEGPAALATEPVDIQHEIVVEKTASYEGTRLSSGGPVRITVVPGLQKIASIGDYEIAIPDTFRFLPLRGNQIRLNDVAEAQDFEKVKTAGVSSVEVVSDGDTYAFRGGNAKGFRDMYSEEEAEFILGALGVSGKQATGLLKKAASAKSATISCTRPVVSKAQGYTESLLKTAASLKERKVSRVDLIKEAAVVLDRETADSVLALNFITPENMSIYVDYLPELEKVASRLAEIVIASRLGMNDVRETAAKNAMTQVNSVINGLRDLQSRIQ